MQLKKFTRKDRHGNMMSFEFDIPQANVPAMQSIPTYDHPGEPKGTDTVPAWLTPGEFVVNKEATEMFGPMIKKINDIGRKKQNQKKTMYANEGELVADTSWITDDLLDALRFVETGNLKPEDMVSPKGAIGPYQIMPDNFGAMEGSKTLGKAGYGTPIITEELAKDPEFARNWAKTYLEGIQKANPNFTKTDVLRAYNAGVGTVNKVKKGDTNFVKEAQEYPGKVFAALGEKTADKIPDVTVQRISPDSASSGAQVATDAQFVPPVNVTMPQRDMASMEPIPGPSSGRIAQVMGNLKPSDDYTNYLRNMRLSADDYFNNDGVIPRANVTLDTRKIPGVNRMLDINQPPGVPIPTGVVDGKRVALTPEYLDAMQDNDMGGLGADSQVFKDFVGSRLRVPTNQAVPPVANVVVPQFDAVKDAQRMIDINKGIPEAPPYIPVDAMIEAKKDKDAFEAKRQAERKRMEEINRGPDDPTMLQDYMRGYAMQGADGSGAVSTESQLSQDPKGPDMGFDIKGFEPEEKEKKDNVAETVLNQTNNDPKPDDNQTKQVTDNGNNASKEEKSKAEGFLKGLFGSLFDSKELKRMAIMYLGSRVMGYGHNGSLNFAVKNYLTRVDAKEAARRTFVTSTEAKRDYTGASLQKFLESGNVGDLIKRTTLVPTQTFEKFYKVDSKGKTIEVLGQKFEKTVGGVKRDIYLDKKGNVINQFEYSANPIFNRGSKESLAAVETYSKNIADLLSSMRNQYGVIGKDKKGNLNYVSDINPKREARFLINHALEEGLDITRFMSAVGTAYMSMVNDPERSGKSKPRSLLGYVNDVYMDQDLVENKNFFLLEPYTKAEKEAGKGAMVSTKRMEQLRQNVSDMVRYKLGDDVKGASDGELFSSTVQRLRPKYDALSDEDKKQFERKAAVVNGRKVTTGFFEYVKEYSIQMMGK